MGGVTMCFSYETTEQILIKSGTEGKYTLKVVRGT